MKHILAFFIAALVVFLVATFAIWGYEHTSDFEPYTGTYLQYVGDFFRGFIDLLKDIW